jgi:protein-arginine kinase activator protein McsA
MPGAPTADRLRERLERAIRNEEFELAASLRDQLRALE